MSAKSIEDYYIIHTNNSNEEVEHEEKANPRTGHR